MAIAFEEVLHFWKEKEIFWNLTLFHYNYELRFEFIEFHPIFEVFSLCLSFSAKSGFGNTDLSNLANFYLSIEKYISDKKILQLFQVNFEGFQGFCFPMFVHLLRNLLRNFIMIHCCKIILWSDVYIWWCTRKELVSITS